MIVEGEKLWMEWLKNNKAQSFAALKVFAANYHYFSLNQVIAFSNIFQAFPPTDREALSMMASVLYDEMGRGRPEQVHSVLFEQFAHAVGVEDDLLPLPQDAVLPGVRGYVNSLNEGFKSNSLPRVLACYEFLENTAVETYAPLLKVLRDLGIGEESLSFFSLHTVVEPHHAAVARELVSKQQFSPEQRRDYQGQLLILERQWGKFWGDIYEASTGRVNDGG